MRMYLSVPFSENEQAKSLGAKWDQQKKQWYAPNSEKALVERWPELPAITTLQGEDRSFGGNTLFVDLVPTTCWFTNVRSCVHPLDWERLRKFVYERANNQCECCNEKTSLEAHERWHFDNETKTQKLMRIIALCKSCHESTHMGLSQIRGISQEATQHLMKVAKLNDEEVKKHIDDAFNLWRERNKSAWTLDLSVITNSGIQLAKKEPEKQERKEIAKEKMLQINNNNNNHIQSTHTTTSFHQQYPHFFPKEGNRKRKLDVSSSHQDVDAISQSNSGQTQLSIFKNLSKKRRQENVSLSGNSTKQPVFIDLTNDESTESVTNINLVKDKGNKESSDGTQFRHITYKSNTIAN